MKTNMKRDGKLTRMIVIGLDMDRLAEQNVEASQAPSLLSDALKYSLDEDFLRVIPRKSIEQLKDCKEEGFCIVLAIVKHVIRGGNWWYTACKCNRVVTPYSRMCYCDGCYYDIVNVFLRYRIKLRVIDESDSATFVLFDRDANYLLKKSCSDMVNQMQKGKPINRNYCRANPPLSPSSTSSRSFANPSPLLLPKISFFASSLWLTLPWSPSSSLSGLSLLASSVSTSKRAFIYSPPPVESLLPPAPPKF